MTPFLSNPAGEFDFFQTRGLTWVEWVSVLGVLVTVLGFAITWWQLARTQKAREAVSKSVAQINVERASARLTDTLPTLKSQYSKATRAVNDGNRDRTRLALETWLSACQQSIQQLRALRDGLTGKRDRPDFELATDTVNRLNSTSSKVAEALYRLSTDTDVEPKQATTYALLAMRECCDIATGLLERQQFAKERAS